MAFEEDKLQFRYYIRVLTDKLSIKKGSKESIIFPVIKNVPSDIFQIASCSYELYNINTVLVASGLGGILGSMIATFQIDTTGLSVGVHTFKGSILLSNGDILKQDIEIEILNA